MSLILCLCKDRLVSMYILCIYDIPNIFLIFFDISRLNDSSVNFSNKLLQIPKIFSVDFLKKIYALLDPYNSKPCCSGVKGTLN